jgi:hypothetical protein
MQFSPGKLFTPKGAFVNPNDAGAKKSKRGASALMKQAP